MERENKNILVKKAADEYLITPEFERSLTKLGNKYNIKRQDISKYLYSIGHEVVNYQNRLRCDETIFDVIDTEEKAYWLGFIFADGNISSTGYKFEINLSGEDYDHLEKLRKFFKYEHKVRIAKQSPKAKGEIVSRLSFRNKRIWNNLYKLGCIPNKTLVAKFPEIDNNLIRHMIRGYCDGDGSLGVYITKDKSHSCQLCFTSGSKDLLDYIYKFLGLNGYFRKRLGKSGNYTHWLNYRGLNARMAARILYENSNIYLDRKFNIFKKFCLLEQECSQMKSSKIGEGWNANTEVIADIAQGSVTP